MGPLVLEDGAIPLSKDYWEVLSLRAYQKLDPAKTRASVYPALDQNGTPILNQDHWQCIMPGGS
jgi:hypothetical protein